MIHVQKWRDIACPSSFGKRAHTAPWSIVHIVQVKVNANDCKTLMQVLFLHYLTLNSGHNKRPQGHFKQALSDHLLHCVPTRTCKIFSTCCLQRLEHLTVPLLHEVKFHSEIAKTSCYLLPLMYSQSTMKKLQWITIFIVGKNLSSTIAKYHIKNAIHYTAQQPQYLGFLIIDTWLKLFHFQLKPLHFLTSRVSFLSYLICFCFRSWQIILSFFNFLLVKILWILHLHVSHVWQKLLIKWQTCTFHITCAPTHMIFEIK